MPSWSARFLPSAPISSRPGSSPNRLQQSGTPYEPATRSYSIPSLEQLSGGNIPAGTEPSLNESRHGRSNSHPFPFIFKSGNREERKGIVERNATASELNDGPRHATGHGKPGGSPPKAGYKASSQQTDTGLITGRCMTCDSLVRWPRRLKVFRCTICLTINDLKLSMSQPSLESGPANASPLQIDHTLSPGKVRSIVDSCVASYLQARLDQITSASITNRSYSTSIRSPIETAGQAETNEFSNPRTQSLSDVSKVTRTVDRQTCIPTVSSTHFSSELAHSSAKPSHNEDVDSPAPTSPASRLPPKVHEHPKASHEGSPRASSRSPVSPIPHGLAGSEGADLNTQNTSAEHASLIFRPLEDYIVTCFGSFDCINTSFSISRPPPSVRSVSEGAHTTDGSCRKTVEPLPSERASISGVDAKTLLLGDFAENGSWWTGGRPRRNQSQRVNRGWKSRQGLKTPLIDWVELDSFYHSVIYAGSCWESKWEQLLKKQSNRSSFPTRTSRHSQHQLHDIASDLAEAQSHAQRALLKATEALLKRPGRPLRSPEDCRFLLILLANPLLYPSTGGGAKGQRLLVGKSAGIDRHSGIVKRVFGLLANVPNECHYYLVAWFSRLSESHFRRLVDLVGSFVTYRLTRQHGRKRSSSHDPTAELIPDILETGVRSSAQLHAALGVAGPSRQADGKSKNVLYGEDWQLRAAARVMSLLFSANVNRSGRKTRFTHPEATLDVGVAARQRAQKSGQMLPTGDFYNTLLDYSDIIADFEAWESKRDTFTFCQYPFFYSIWAKIHILEYDARRQMEVKAREAFFNSIMGRKAISQYLVLKIRRDCLVEDSLRGVSESVSSGQEDIKKSLKIEFVGEEGVDAGGLRKEWFLLLVREVFDPHHGMFCYDEDSKYCYFNPHCFETSDQFFLVGVVLGLAIYNSTILDVALPPFAFKKLLGSAPTSNVLITSSHRPPLGHTLEDLAEFRPALAQGLRLLLEFTGDVESTFCRDFVAEVECYGQISQIPLCPKGETRPVTKANRREFVDLYVHYLLDTAVARQYEPFKRGFYTVCGGNALSLFRPEEIELLVRGSDETLDIASLRAVAVYEHWGSDLTRETEPVTVWFWDFFETMDPRNQRKLLCFITGSDRIPAMGAASLVIKIMCLGDDCDRFPIARTCFNIIGLYKYASREKLAAKVSRAIAESEGFGLR